MYEFLLFTFIILLLGIKYYYIRHLHIYYLFVVSFIERAGSFVGRFAAEIELWLRYHFNVCSIIAWYNRMQSLTFLQNIFGVDPSILVQVQFRITEFSHSKLTCAGLDSCQANVFVNWKCVAGEH